MTTQTNPFVGPRSFEAGEKLYGRDRELRGLMALLIAERIVVLHSPSGAGKTSLLKAGLLPKLRSEEFNVLPIIRVNTQPPAEAGDANRYLLSTKLALEDGFPPEERLPLSELLALNLDQYLTKRAPKPDSILVLDQFEEIFTTRSADREAKMEFFTQLGEALRNNKSRWALFSMREDYLGMLAPYCRPIPNRLVTRFRLDLLTSESAIQAMQMPAKSTGVNFTVRAAQKLADDLRRIQVQLPDGSMEEQLGPYIEPVQLQVVCFRLWESLSEKDLEIDEQDLAKVGDVNQSLAAYYAQTVAEVARTGGTPERSIRMWFDRKLITPDGLRSQVRFTQDSSEGLPNPDIRLLENKHILRTDQRGGQSWIELSHDRLLEPVRANNRSWFRSNLTMFQRRAELWADKKDNEALLLRGAELEKAQNEARDMELTDEERQYLAACRELGRRLRREKLMRRAVTAGMVISFVMFLVAVYFWLESSQANQKSIQAAVTANVASTNAIAQQITAEAASTRAINQQATAEAASTLAIKQQAAAEAASTRAISNAYAASTALAKADAEKANALAQEAIAMDQKAQAEEQKAQAVAIALVAQSLNLQQQLQDVLSSLLAIEAFKTKDITNTRIQMLARVYSRGRLPLVQSRSLGVISTAGYFNGNEGLAISNFFGCDELNYFLCETGKVQVFDIQRDTRPDSKMPSGIRSDVKNTPFRGWLDTMAVHPDGIRMATASCVPNPERLIRCNQEVIAIWDIKTRTQIGEAWTYTGEIANDKQVQMLFSPDGKTLALVLNIGTIFNPAPNPAAVILFWNMDTLQQTGPYIAPEGLSQIAFSPDGMTISMAHRQGVTLLDVASQHARELEAVKSFKKAVTSTTFSPDGSLLAAGLDDGSIVLVDIETDRSMEQVLRNTSRPLSMDFNPSGSILAAGYQDAGLVLWDMDSKTRLIEKTIYKHAETPDYYPIYNLSFSPDGKQLVTVSDEIIIWDINPSSWVTKACIIAGRNMTQAEWLRFFPNQPYKTICDQFPPD